MARKTIIALVGILVLAALARPVLAGGWAVITLEEWPGEIPTGEPVQLSYTIRGHGVQRLSNVETVVRLLHPATGERITATGRETARDGTYAVDLTLPHAGAWEWSVYYDGISDWGFPMPALTAVEATEAPAVLDPLRATGGVLGAALLAGGALAFVQRRSRWAGLAAAAGLALILVFVPTMRVEPVLAGSETAGRAEMTPAEFGRILFQAKGCVVCHTHVEGRLGYQGLTTDVGPNLTGTKLPAEYIETWLADPSAVKPETEMPNLELSQQEIEALAAFLTR